MVLEYINKENKFNSIKEVAKSYFHISSHLLTKLKNKKLIYLNDKQAYVSAKISLNDIVKFDLGYEEETDNIVPVKMDLDIIYEDDSLLIINKPPFMTVHPSQNHFEDSLSNGVKYHFNQIGLKKKIRPVNRLDKNTSGLIVFAKNEYVQESLIFQMKTNTFSKKYLAVLDGVPSEKQGTIIAPISRKEGSIMERVIDFDNGQYAETAYKVLRNSKTLSLVEFSLKTGRTHQIRVHSKYLGCPILGDSLYNKESSSINRQALHSYNISFLHPINNSLINIEISLPDDMKSLVQFMD